ncbi:MAG: hypothetical protein NC308_02335 [Clostridium sp.]|nr:hypothetical protein [Bacteroides sp.]MCM1197701.1 hypothetical protein [Clostridium sp.]
MEQKNTMEDIEQMRSQIELLKKKVAEDELVSRKMLRNAMKRNISSFNSNAMTVNILAIAAMCFCGHFLLDAGFSMYFVAGTMVFLLVCLAKNIAVTRGMRTDAIMNDNLVDAGAKVVKTKERHLKSFRIMLPLLALWIVWFFAEAAMMGGNEGYVIGLITGGSIGGITGGFLGYRKHRKIVRALDEIISQIETLKKDDAQCPAPGRI